MEFLFILGQDVKVSIKPAQRNLAEHLTVQVGV